MVGNIHYRWDFIGLSTDNKPTPADSPKVVNGSTFYESNTSKLYVFYNNQWYERKPLGGGGGGGSYTAGEGITIADDTISVDTTAIQTKLTAGSNITISDDTISATDTTYSNFTGTDGTADGVAGLVPAPLIADAGEYLKADGTWSTPPDTTYTAGTNITITNGEISATDTTYSNFTGTDGTAAGASGLVPAPATTDAGKFLKADGTWDTAGGGSGPTVVQTTGTSTTDVMSQNAVTSMVFADQGNSRRVKIGNNNSASGGNNFGYVIAGNNNTLKNTYGGVLLGDHSNVGANNSSNYAVAIGSHANATGNQSVALGLYPTASGANSIAIGGSDTTLTVASAYNSIALGGAQATVQGQFDVSTGTNATGGYNSSNYRLLTGLYDGQSAHDAATVGQITPITDSSAPTTATVGRLGQIFIDTTNADAYMCVAVDSVTPSYTWKKINA